MRAAELGHVPSMERVAFALLYGNNLHQDIGAAKAMFEKLAMLGSPRGQLVMVYVDLCCVSEILAVAAVCYWHYVAVVKLCCSHCHLTTRYREKSCQTFDVFFNSIYPNDLYSQGPHTGRQNTSSEQLTTKYGSQ